MRKRPQVREARAHGGETSHHEQKCKNVTWAIERAKLFEEMDARLAGAPAQHAADPQVAGQPAPSSEVASRSWCRYAAPREVHQEGEARPAIRR
jgi:hypothetical protein